MTFVPPCPKHKKTMLPFAGNVWMCPDCDFTITIHENGNMSSTFSVFQTPSDSFDNGKTGTLKFKERKRKK